MCRQDGWRMRWKKSADDQLEGRDEVEGMKMDWREVVKLSNGGV